MHKEQTDRQTNILLYIYRLKSYYVNSIFWWRKFYFEKIRIFYKPNKRFSGWRNRKGAWAFGNFLVSFFFRQTLYRFEFHDPENLQSSFIKNPYFLKIDFSSSKKSHWNKMTYSYSYHLYFQFNSKYLWKPQYLLSIYQYFWVLGGSTYPVEIFQREHPHWHPNS